VTGTKKVMLTVIWGFDEFHVVDMMPPRGRFNAYYFLTHILDLLLAKVLPERRKSRALRLSVRRSSNASQQFLMKTLSPLFLIRHTVLTWHFDFWLFEHVKIFVVGGIFNVIDELLETVAKFVNDNQSSELQLGFHHWAERVKLVLASNGDHSHEWTTEPEFAR
jgi:hypothetical protein